MEKNAIYVCKNNRYAHISSKSWLNAMAQTSLEREKLGLSFLSDTHPWFIFKEGATKVNHHQRIPHLSKDARSDPALYDMFMDSMQPICPIFRDLLLKHLPSVYTRLSTFCDLLPLNYTPQTYPFPGLVTNVQVATDAHFRWCDDTICIVMSWGSYEGGQLVLEGAGIVLDLPSGAVVIFPSWLLVHYNLHFTGFRGSIVLHCDKQGRCWVEDRNGWCDHIV